MLEEDDRTTLEEAILDAHLAAERYLSSGRDIHRKILEVTVEDAIAALSMYSELLKDDPKSENYKMHMLVPMQVLELIEDDKNES
jgi:hypothetical protein